jgi:hypothetical protein
MTSLPAADTTGFPPGLMHRHACLLSFLRLNPSLTRAQYMDVAGVSRNTAARDLALLRRLGLILCVGQGPASRYCLPHSPFAGDAASAPGQPHSEPTFDPISAPSSTADPSF